VLLAVGSHAIPLIVNHLNISGLSAHCDCARCWLHVLGGQIGLEMGLGDHSILQILLLLRVLGLGVSHHKHWSLHFLRLLTCVTLGLGSTLRALLSLHGRA